MVPCRDDIVIQCEVSLKSSLMYASSPIGMRESAREVREYPVFFVHFRGDNGYIASQGQGVAMAEVLHCGRGTPKTV